MMNNKCELLSPAGSYDCVMAAINAGADAVYLGAQRFSARAYAGNLSDEELINSIYKCHLRNVKVYLTLNTLVGPDEIDDAVCMISPFYEAGLDGVIIQDLGIASLIKDNYPGLELHASTQMSIMSSEGVELMSRYGFSRIVPARELTLGEIKTIKSKTGAELECFIHGAMCYSYSGLCLMSSMIGGRSGNRGRCAGTCRLPYEFSKAANRSGREQYPLSMKDMCTVNYLPRLIDAGIDSFKIEGRMKSPEYVAGVTRIYRKYIDLYLNNPKSYAVEQKDLDELRRLYIRTDICEGYYEGASGRSLITMDMPGYSGLDSSLTERLSAEYVHEPEKIHISLKADIHIGRPAALTAVYKEISAAAEGQIVQSASKAPLTGERICEQLGKSGGTDFIVDNTDINLDDNVFMPMSALNELRRSALDKLAQEIVINNGLCLHRDAIKINNNEPKDVEEAGSCSQSKPHGSYTGKAVDVQVSTQEQLSCCAEENADRVYIQHYLFMKLDDDTIKEMPLSVSEIYVSLPYTYRSTQAPYYEKLISRILELNKTANCIISGVLVHTLDEYELCRKRLSGLNITADSSIYAFNPDAAGFICENTDMKGLTLSLESKLSAMHRVTEYTYSSKLETNLIVYGRTAMMITAGCVKKTYNVCDRQTTLSKECYITDRLGNKFPVMSDCGVCTNVIYNCRPLCLYNMKDKINKVPADRLRIDLTLEGEEESTEIIRAFKYDEALSLRDYTTGHIKRGVE